MRTLNRPMFNMGGPIKEGIMHGIREPKRDGGKMLLAGQHPQQFKDAGGREQHAWPLLYYGAQALRAMPSIYRGLKAGRMFAPGKLGAWNRFKSMLGPSGRFRTTTSQVPQQGNILTEAQIKAGMIPKMESTQMGILQALKDPKRFGMALRENPLTVASLATVPASGIDLGRKYGADVGKGAWNLAKRFGAAVVPGDQSHWYEKPIEHDIVPGVPGGGETALGSRAAYYDKDKKVEKKLTKAQQEKWADAQRGKRLNNLLEIMGYDQSKKTAIADALIDASKIVGDRGSLDPKNITQELINPIIQATSKRLDKPDQIREAVGLMMAKGEIEKDLYKWKPGTQLKNAQDMADTLNIPLEEAMNMVTGKANTLGEELGANQTAKRKPLVASEVEQLTRVWADKKKKNFQKTWTATEIKEAGLDKEDAVDIVSKAITGPDDDGLYVVGTEVIEVINGVAKKKW